MAKTGTNSSDLDNKAKITLGLLNMVHDNSATSQRSMAGDLGIALGLANAYLKRCVKKGLIKVSQVPANRYAYYLTPKGLKFSYVAKHEGDGRVVQGWSRGGTAEDALNDLATRAGLESSDSN